MPYTCELCGNSTDQKIMRTIEGVKMLVCRDCMMMGEKTEFDRRPSQVQKKKPRYYLDNPMYTPQKRRVPQASRKSRPTIKKPKNVPIDRLKLIENYRNILKKLRQQNSMDQGEFSNSVGITHTSYRNIEAGKLELTIQEARRIEKKYEVELTEMISEYEEDTYDQYLHHGKSTGSTLGDVYLKKKK